MKVEIISYTLDPLTTIERGASECYQSSPTATGKITNHCFQSGHQSVLEHCNFTFRIEGISRSCLAQLTRHRIGSYSVKSQRYCNESNFEYVTSNKISKHCKSLFDSYMEQIQEMYNTLQSEMIKQGYKKEVANEEARAVLPNACTTNVVCTYNMRSLMNLCNERLCVNAQDEIRLLVTEMKNCVQKISLQLASYLVPKCEKNPPLYFCPETLNRCCGKHLTKYQIKERLSPNEY